MTKEDFRKVVAAASERLTSMPDEIWDNAYCLMRLTFKTKEGVETVVVGIERATKEDKGDEDEAV
jgi:hypothetical protein